MKRIHIGMTVADLDASARFYSTLFGAEPTLRKPDYAKWMLDDPRVNFSITSQCCATDRIHLGIQVEAAEELADTTARLKQADLAVRETPGATCCYAHSDKTWAADPDGTPWETFLTHGQITHYGVETVTDADVGALAASSRACCGGGAAETEDAKGEAAKSTVASCC